MSEETAGAETPAADGNTPEATVENTSEATTGGQSEATNESEASASDDTGGNSGDDASAEKSTSWASDRIKELTRKRREAERRAERAEQRLREAESQNLDDLEYEDQIAERTLRRTRKENLDTERETARELALEVFATSEGIARGKYADYDAVTRNPSLPITESILDAVADEDNGPDVLYHLGKNPALAHEIARMPVARQARELGKLAAKLSAPKPQPKQPPTPVSPVSAIAAGGSKDPGNMSMSEYIAWRAGQKD